MTSTEANIARYRQKALNVLKPSRKQIEHGLELHRQSIVCDSFGFMPIIWTRELFDRLNTMLDDAEIAEALAAHADPSEACRDLVRRANARGGEDNTTVVVVRFSKP